MEDRFAILRDQRPQFQSLRKREYEVEYLSLAVQQVNAAIVHEIFSSGDRIDAEDACLVKEITGHA